MKRPLTRKPIKSRRRLLASDSRDLILKESLKLISQKGWQSLTFEAVAKRAKISPANVLYHFTSKAELFQVLLRLVTKNNHEIVSNASIPGISTLERITEYFRLNFDWAARYPLEAHVIVCVYQDACTDERMSATFVEILKVARGRLKHLILDGIEKGDLKPRLSAETCAALVHDLLVGEFIARMGTRIAAGPTKDPDLASIQTALRLLLEPS